MAKSIRSKSKRKFRAIKRQQIFGPAEEKRLGRLVHRLHAGSKVVSVPEPEPLPKMFSFSFKEALLDAPARAREEAARAAKMDEDDTTENTTYGDAESAAAAASGMDVDAKKAGPSRPKSKKKLVIGSKSSGTLVVRKTKRGKLTTFKW
ncbi:hypothetical protein H9P43_002923 [Blastocladiella emersonii ATCC 22665]|nr:hypothetical protein H9P43_002923 [Blastocladiella emersonii ATCC 22665]